MIYQHVRDNNNNPVGYMVAVETSPSIIQIGVSLYNPKDKWDRDRGRQIALGRAWKDGIMPHIPKKKEKYVVKAYESLVNRAEKYFKGAIIISQPDLRKKYAL